MTSIFFRFFSDFHEFGSILEGPGPSKKIEKIEKIAFGAILKFSIDLGTPRDPPGPPRDPPPGPILKGFLMDLKGILGGFLEGWINIFGEDAKNMIRATKGKSMDGWMDGWMDG